MKTQNVTIRVFEAGDRVCTGDGDGTVIRDNINEMPAKDFYNELHIGWSHRVTVQHDEGSSNNTNNEPREIDSANLILLDKNGNCI